MVEQPKKFTFHPVTMFMANDGVRLECYVVTMKQKRKKLVDRNKHLDLAEENLSTTEFINDDDADGGRQHRYIGSKGQREL